MVVQELLQHLYVVSGLLYEKTEVGSGTLGIAVTGKHESACLRQKQSSAEEKLSGGPHRKPCETTTRRSSLTRQDLVARCRGGLS